MNKQSIYFISGWGAASGVWSSLVEKLPVQYDCVYLDLYSVFDGDFPAFTSDSSDKKINEWGDAYVDKLATLLPAASVVIAWSLGGMLATAIAARYPEKISKLVLFATNAVFVESAGWQKAMSRSVFNEFFETFSAFPEKARKRFAVLQAMGVADKKTLLKTLENVSSLGAHEHAKSLSQLLLLESLDNTERLFSLSMPVLLFFGVEDVLVPASSAEKIRQKYLALENGVNKKVVLIDACGHAPHLSHAEVCANLLTGFLGALDERYHKDKRRIASSFSSVSKSYDKYAGLQREVARELVRWTHEVKGRVADLGCGTGFCIEALLDRYSNISSVAAVDIAPNMLRHAQSKKISDLLPIHFCQADIEHLPFCADQFDFVISSLAIQWCEDLHSMFSGVYESLSENGRFAFSNLGRKTLNELRLAWSEADSAHVHVNQFFSEQEIVEAAESTGFEMDKLSVQEKIMEYSAVVDLMRDLKGIGAHNINGGSAKGLTGKSTIKTLEAAYERFRLGNGSLPATYEVQYWFLRKKRVLP